MKRVSRQVILVAVVAAVLGAVASSAALISYDTWSANRNRVMVMDDSGANQDELYRGLKFSPFGVAPTISPAGTGDTWIAFTDADIDIGVGRALYKVKADGSGFTKVLCSGYDGQIGGASYTSVGSPRWSPDDRWIAVQMQEGIALVPSDFAVGLGTVGADCAAPIQFIYPDPLASPEWDLESSVAWNHDGEQMAFFEILYPRDPNNEQIRVVILEYLEGSGWYRLREVKTDIELFGKWPFGPDWQRGGSLLALMTREGDGPQGKNRITLVTLEDVPELDLLAGDWWYEVDGSGVSWSPDNSYMLIVNDKDQIVKWSYPGGPGEVLASGGSPEWQRDAPSCTSDADCEDLNDCTDDTCISGRCSFDAVTDETTCNSGEGICCGGTCAEPACSTDGDCDEPDPCTDDTCFAGNTCAAYCDNQDNGLCSCLPKGEVCDPDIPCCSGQCHRVKNTCK